MQGAPHGEVVHVSLACLAVVDVLGLPFSDPSAALHGFAAIAGCGRMPDARLDAVGRLHEELVRPVLEAQPAKVFLVDPPMKALANGLGQAKPDLDIRYFEAIEPMRKAIRPEIREGDLLLVKGSNSMRLAEPVRYFS